MRTVSSFAIAISVFALAACSDDAAPVDAGLVVGDASGGDASAIDAREPDLKDAGAEPTDAAADAGGDAGTVGLDGSARDANEDGGALDATLELDGGDLDATVDPDAGTSDLGPRPRLAFSRGSGAATTLWLAELDGTAEAPLTMGAGIHASPSWSPDGSTIAFASTRGGRYAIWKLDLATRTPVLVTDQLLASLGPVWSPDGARIAFQGRASTQAGFDVYVTDAAGSPPVQLTTDAANDSGPTWSPDGATIYFVSNRAGPYEIWAMDADGMNQRQITIGSRIIGRPVATPDGGGLLFTSGDENQTVLYRWDLVQHTLTTLSADHDAEPNISPDGRWAAFSTTRFGSTNPELMVLDLVTPGATAVRATTNADVDGMPAIGPPIP